MLVYIYLYYIECNTGNSVSPHYLTTFETDVLFTCSHVPHASYQTYIYICTYINIHTRIIYYIYYYIPSVQNYVCVLFFFNVLSTIFDVSRGTFYMGLFLFFFFVVKREVFFKTHLCRELVTAYCPDCSNKAEDKDDGRKKNTCLDFSYNYII